jgi:2-polyprenyl-6-methoxyphenol hydroxylase-like FAD-dependent oxidoreductase
VGGTAAVAVVGAGPVGATLALDLARFEVPVVLLDAKPQYAPEGSKAMVLARHAFDAFSLLGCSELVRKAVVLERARTYYRDVEIFCIDFPPPAPGETPLFANLQQAHVERALLQRVEERAGADVWWGAVVERLRQEGSEVVLGLASGEEVRAAYVVGADGAHSSVRKLLAVEFPGRSFRDRFLIADIRAELPFPNERRFFFDPPFNPGRQVLVHPQPEGEWRIDWQVPPEMDDDEERRSGRLDERVRAIAGDVPYEFVWLSAYRFHERVAARFRVGRVFLAGDAAHLFAPFGARGLNSGVEDARNLGWKLALVLKGRAPESLLDSYERERRRAALVNLRVTSATMRFMAPPTPVHRAWRNVVLRGSVHSRWLRRLVDSGKLATPAVYADGNAAVGRPAPPLDVHEMRTDGFVVATPRSEPERYLLVRPDGYVAAELRPADIARIDAAVRSALEGF